MPPASSESTSPPYTHRHRTVAKMNNCRSHSSRPYTKVLQNLLSFSEKISVSWWRLLKKCSNFAVVKFTLVRLLSLIISVMIIFVGTVGVYESDCCGCCQGSHFALCESLSDSCGECDGGCDCDDCVCSPFLACTTCVGFMIQNIVAVNEEGYTETRELIISYNNFIPCGWYGEIMRPPRFIG